MGELLRTVAYIAEREEEGTVNYTTLQADFLKPMANKSALQELGLPLPLHITQDLVIMYNIRSGAGRDFHIYVENRVKTIIDENLSHTDSMSS